MALEQFEKLIDSFKKKNNAVKSSDREKEVMLEEGLTWIHEVLLDIEAEKSVQSFEEDTVDSVLLNLHSFVNIATENIHINVSYTTARLAVQVLSKLDSMQDQKQQAHYQELIEIIHKLKAKNQFNVSSFISATVDLKLSVDMLAALHCSDLLPLSVYIAHHSEDSIDSFLEEFLVKLFDVHISEIESAESSDVYIDMLIILIQMSLGEKIAACEPPSISSCSESCKTVLDKLISKMAEKIKEAEMSSTVIPGEFLSLLSKYQWKVGRSAIVKFLSTCLQQLVEGPMVTVEQALHMQQQWLKSEYPQHFVRFVQSLLLAFGTDAPSAISSLLEEEKANFEVILPIILVFLSHIQTAPSIFKGMLDAILTQALAAQNKSQLGMVFLLARHACFANVPSARQVFPSYGAWFSSTFGTEAGFHTPTASFAPTFSFLLEFLNNLVPYESPLCLRVHINKVPLAPPQCSQLLGDYVTLAKTRLQDLGETTGSGLFAFEFTPKQDVETALDYFEKNEGQVSRILLDSCIFRRKQYEQQFLPALLIPEPTCLGVPLSTRQLLITKLKALGKISQPAIERYEQACQSLNAGQQKGSGTSVQTADPLEIWQISLEGLVRTVKDGGIGTEGVINTEMKTMLEATSVQLREVVNWARSQRDTARLYGKVVSHLLKASMLVFEPPTPSEVLEFIVWPQQVVILLAPYPKLLRALIAAVRRVAVDCSMEKHNIQAAAALACACDVEESKNVAQASGPKVGELISNNLKPRNRDSMLKVLLFCSTYLCLSHNVSLSDVPLHLIKLFAYLRGRLVYSTDDEVQSICASSWNPPVGYFLHHSKMSLQEWLEMESQIDTSEDPVKPHYNYLCAWLTQLDAGLDTCVASKILIACVSYIDQGVKLGEELLKVLPVLTFSNRSKEDKTCPWLLNTWQHLNKKHSYDKIFSIVINLPPWMLLKNCLYDSVNKDVLQPLADFISQNLVDGLSKNSFLPLNMTSMVLSAIQMIASSQPGLLLSQFLEICPAVHLSLLVNYQHLHHLLQSVFQDTAPKNSNVHKIVELYLQICNKKGDMNASETWEGSLLLWSRGALMGTGSIMKPVGNDSSSSLIFFRVLALTNQLLASTASIICSEKKVILFTSEPYPIVALAEEVHKQKECLEMLSFAANKKPISLPVSGLPTLTQFGLCLTTVAILLTLPSQRLSPESKRTLSVCLNAWLTNASDIPNCPDKLCDYTFLGSLTSVANSYISEIEILE